MCRVIRQIGLSLSMGYREVWCLCGYISSALQTENNMLLYRELLVLLRGNVKGKTL